MTVLCGVHPIDDVQAHQGQFLVDVVKHGRVVGDDVDQAAGADDFGVGADFRLEPLYHGGNQAGVAQHQARLQGGGGIASDRFRRGYQFDPAEQGGVVIQGVSGQIDARRNRATQVLAVAGNGVKHGGGAQVNHDDRRAVKSDGGHRVHDAVGAHVAGVVVADGHTQVNLRVHQQGRDAEKAAAHVLEQAGEGRHH